MLFQITLGGLVQSQFGLLDFAVGIPGPLFHLRHDLLQLQKGSDVLILQEIKRLCVQLQVLDFPVPALRCGGFCIGSVKQF